MTYTSQVPTAFRALQGAAAALSMLQSGFTTVRDLGNGGLYADTALRQAVEQGLVPGPTIVNAGAVPLTLTIGSAAAQDGLTVYVK